MVEQLRCLGILATCEVLKAGMPTRVTYKELRAALAGLPRDTQDLFAGQPEEVGKTWTEAQRMRLSMNGLKS